MANIFKNIDLFHDEPYDSWREKYWIEKNKNKDATQNKLPGQAIKQPLSDPARFQPASLRPLCLIR